MSLAAALQEKFPVRRQSSSQQKVARGGGVDGPPPLGMSLSSLLGCVGRSPHTAAASGSDLALQHALCAPAELSSSP